MTEQVQELIESEKISQLKIIEMIETFKNLVELNVLDDVEFLELLSKLGVENPEPNKFVMDEETFYELP